MSDMSKTDAEIITELKKEEEEEEVNGVCAGCGCEGKYLKDINDTDPCWYCLDCSSI